MTDTGWTAADLLASVHYDELPAEMAVRMARQAAGRQDREDAAAEAERLARIEDEHEQRLFRYRQLGVSGRSVTEMMQQAVRAADEEDRVAEARETIERAERRRESEAQVMRSQAQALEAVARRAVVTDPLELATMRAQAAIADEERRRRAVLEQARAEQQRYRPQVSRSQPRRQEIRRHVSFRSAFPFGAESAGSREDLARLGPGQSSEGGCPPCSGCDYVICRCG